MTVEELKNKVLQDVPITQAEAEWLATQPDKEALYEAAHEISFVLHHQCKVRPLPRKLQMVRTIITL